MKRLLLLILLSPGLAFAQGSGVASTAGKAEYQKALTRAGKFGLPGYTTANLPTCSANERGVAYDETDNVPKYCDGSSWAEMGGAGAGDVFGPASSTDNALPRFDGTGGKTLQASDLIVDDSENVSGVETLQFNAGGAIRSATSNTNTLLVQVRDTDGSWKTFATGTAGSTPTFDLDAAVTIASTGILRGALGATDNRLVRTDGTGTLTAQGTGITVDDSDNVSGVAALSATTIDLGASDTTLARSGAGAISVEGVGVALLTANTFVAGQVIDGTADEIQQRIQGHSTQTASVRVVETSDGTDTHQESYGGAHASYRLTGSGITAQANADGTYGASFGQVGGAGIAFAGSNVYCVTMNANAATSARTTCVLNDYASGNFNTLLTFPLSLESVTTTKTPSATAEGNERYNNAGDADGATITLPNDPATAPCYHFGVVTAQTLTIAPNTGESLYLGTDQCVASITSATVGASLTVCALSTGSGAIWAAPANAAWTCND